jgi:hypothetical protein
VSPHARPDYVFSEVFDHTSVLRLLEKWNLSALAARDAASSLGALNLTGRRPSSTRSLPEPCLKWGSW